MVGGADAMPAGVGLNKGQWAHGMAGVIRFVALTL